MRAKLALVLALFLLPAIGCSRQRRLPVAAPPPLPAPETRLYQRPYPIVWDTVRVDLANDDRLEPDTIDKRGRFVAWTKSNSFFLLRGRRDVVTIELEPVGQSSTRMVLQMSAQRYEAGGLRRPADWYPDRSINDAMGEQIAARLDQRLDHTPGLADEVALEDRQSAQSLPPAPAEYRPRPQAGPAAAQPAPTAEPAATDEEQRSFFRRLWPFGRS